VTAAVHSVVGNLTARLPHLTTLHDVFRPDQFAGWKGRLKRRFLASLARQISTVVSVGHDVQANLLDYLPALERSGGPRLVIIPNGIEARPCDDEPGTWLRARFGCGDEVAVLGFMGRFMEQKGVTHLLQALEVLCREGSPRPVHLVAVGSGDRRSRYEREIAARGLTQQVTLLDFTPDVLPLLRQLDLLLVPSLWEASPLLPMEAMSAGVPVLGSNCIGLREVLAGTPSRQFAAGDVTSLVRALRDALAEPWTEAAHAYAAVARRRFDSQLAARRFLAEFDRLFGGRSGEQQKETVSRVVAFEEVLTP
jgi:glycosyltransferase involved in cell wall biosynthesis